MPVVITCKQTGFRRCGIAHDAGPITYPDDRWTPDEIRRFQRDTMFTVEFLEPTPSPTLALAPVRVKRKYTRRAK